MGLMSFELFKKVVDEANEIGVGAITLASRGEPMLHKNFSEMLDYLGKKENIFEIKINTNATFLSEEICHSIFKNNVAQIVISADHYQKDEYERLRKNSNYEKILKNVDNLFEIRKKFYQNSTTEIRISGIDFEKNLNREKFKNFWIKRSDHVTASFALERWNTYENEPHQDVNDPCENLWDRMYVWFDGKVNPCDADYKSFLSYGNAVNNSIKEIWNNQIITKLREEHLNNERKKTKPCDICGATFV
jgi:radical SAM protein with 4Fe4S-binding SPASM domain